MGWIEGVVASFVVGFIANTVVPKLWNGAMFKLKKTAMEKADVLFKNPEVRAWALQGVGIAQKLASTDESIDKIKTAFEFIKHRIPGPLDDPIIDALRDLAVKEIKINSLL